MREQKVEKSLITWRERRTGSVGDQQYRVDLLVFHLIQVNGELSGNVSAKLTG